MRMLTWLSRGLLNRLRNRRLDADLDDEIAAHLACRLDDLVRTGMTPEQARTQARREFGALDRFREEAREARQPWRLEHALRDVRYSARSLFRHPVFLGSAVLSIALGTGVNAVLFSTIRAVLFPTPTVMHADRLTWVEPGNSNQFGWANYRDLRESGIFEATAGFRATSLSVRVSTIAERADGLVVTPDFFDTLGHATSLGRAFGTAEADAEGQPRLAVISFDSWRRRFNGDAQVVGRAVWINGEAFTVTGVLRDGYVPPSPLHSPELYVAVSSLTLPDVTTRSNANGLNVIGRLRDGTTPEQAAVQVTALGAELARQFSEDSGRLRRPASVSPFSEPADMLTELRTVGAIVSVLCALVLLIACANVAGLTLARAATRERELALRAALGATRRRVVQLLFTESLLVAGFGTALGLGMAALSMPFMQSLTIDGLGTLRLAVRPDGAFVAYGVALAALSAVATGLLPAWRLSCSVRESAVLRDGTAGASARLGLRFAFVVSQVAGAVVLLALGMMLLRSIHTLRSHEAGFDMDRAVVVSIHQDAAGFAHDGGLHRTRTVIDMLAGAGFDQAAVAAIVPLSPESSAVRLRRDDQPPDTVGTRVLINTIGPRYFEALGIPLRRGRAFDGRDREGTPPSVIVNERLVHELFPDGDAVGHRLVSGNDAPLEIVGVVGDTKQLSLGEAPRPLVYLAFEQQPRLSSQVRDLHVLVRTPDDPERHVRALEQIVREQLGHDAIVTARTLRAAASLEINLRRASSHLLAVVGLLGLVLAATGLYGVMAYVVATSARELGIRLALGAPTRVILLGTLRRGLTLVLVGLACGLPLAIMAGRALRAIIGQLQPADPVAIGGVAVLLLSVGALASYVPARRASRVDPGAVLRRTQ